MIDYGCLVIVHDCSPTAQDSGNIIPAAFSNPEKKTAFEFRGGRRSERGHPESGRPFREPDPVAGDNHIHVRLSGQNTSGGYAVYKIRETAFGGGTKLSAEDGFLQFMIERLLSSNAPEGGSGGRGSGRSRR